MLDLVRKKSAKEALTILRFLPHAGAKLALETLKSAVANAKHNYKLDEDSLVVAECFVGPAVTMKRFRAQSRGRAASIMKRSSHITFFVESFDKLSSEAK